MSRRKSTLRAKLIVASQQERIQKQKDFKNLPGKSSKITGKPIKIYFKNQLDIKFGQFTEEEPDIVLKEIKNR